MVDCTVSNNATYGEAVHGPGVWGAQRGIWLENIRVVGNKQYSYGDGNKSYGGGIVLDGAGSVLRDSVICATMSDGAKDEGFGVWAAMGTIVTNCIVHSNRGTAVRSSAAVMTQGESATIGDKSYTKPCEIVGCTISNNFGVGSVAVSPGSGTVIRNTLISGFTGYGTSSSAAIALTSTKYKIENCTIAGNEKGVWCSGNVDPAMINCAFYNTADIHQAMKESGHSGISFTNCYFASESQIGSQQNEGCVFSNNPNFVDATSGDYRLRRASVLVDRALSLDWMNGAMDLSGNHRVLDSHGEASTLALPDIGCYEFALKPKEGLILTVR